jgi:hypothetical protein
MINSVAHKILCMTRCLIASLRQRFLSVLSCTAFALCWAALIGLAIPSIEGCTPIPIGDARLARIQAIATPTADLPRKCVAQYNALLDLASLARSYGPSSGIFLDALGQMADELDECLSEGGGQRSEGLYRMSDSINQQTPMAQPPGSNVRPQSLPHE